MKNFYILLTFLVSFNLVSAQDEMLLGEWFLQSITTNGVQHDNYFGEVPLNFTETNPLPENESIFTFEGGLCSPYLGSYSASGSALTIYDLNELATCDFSTAHGKYWDKYRDIFSTDLTYQDLTYTITGEGLDQILTLFSNNGDFIVYGKQIPTETIFQTWYSFSTEKADGIFYPSPLEPTTFEISPTNYDVVSGLVANGSGGCNDFNAYHNIYSSNENEFDISIFDQTLLNCDDNFYEPTYFSVLSNETNNTFSYELQDDGNTLILTNQIGEVLTFGEQAPPPGIINNWFLYYVIVDGNQTNRPEGTLPIIEFTTVPDGEGFYFGGIVACTGYGGSYNFNPQQTFDAVYFNTTLGDPCDTNEENTFEDLYFYSVLDNPDDNSTELDYEIIGTGDDATLIVTNVSNGNQAFYGRQALSTDENDFNSSKLQLIKNPVTNHLELLVNQNVLGSNYEIFSMTGQRVSNGLLNSNSINVNQLQSGLYFLKVSSENNVYETVKFIKE
ncbi:T9SS type A sorting domain-containing protein [Psychroserpens sp. Hel_I_66]|uniref:T9SS type A sorting domain-containing protein n=1 Tax=Psychroserpens sp. Hel_I_66 TaxID=1250004 RepID=UPI00064856A5|nr:T9SS type A sorting domain-containing protein [Psychroserpens sp. Hel_I_66]